MAAVGAQTRQANFERAAEAERLQLTGSTTQQ